MGPLSGRWRQGGNDQQCLAAPIWKYRSGFGDHRFTFFLDLLPNYTFYTNLTNVVHWVFAFGDMAHPIALNLGKSWEKYAKSFDAGLTHWSLCNVAVIVKEWVWNSLRRIATYSTWNCFQVKSFHWCFVVIVFQIQFFQSDQEWLPQATFYNEFIEPFTLQVMINCYLALLKAAYNAINSLRN